MWVYEGGEELEMIAVSGFKVKIEVDFGKWVVLDVFVDT